MDKIFLKMAMAQGSIDLLFNAYNRHPAFELSDEDVLGYIYYFDAVLESIQNELLNSKLINDDLKHCVRTEMNVMSRYV